VIDRASDFCKYGSDTDYRMLAKEEPHIWDEVFITDPYEQHTQNNLLITFSPLTNHLSSTPQNPNPLYPCE
jgi:hypothetical protein